MDDRKIKYVDLNGLKCFAEELKKYLRDHVLEFSIFNELKDRIEAVENQDFYEVVDSYNDLPKPGRNKLIYLVPENGSFLEYIWKGDAYEQLGSFTPQLSLDKYLKIEDSPFEKGEADNSAVLKGGNNQVISEGGVALGKDNLVGLKGWYYKDIWQLNNANAIIVTLSNEQKICKVDESLRSDTVNPDNIDQSLPNLAELLGIDTIVSLVNDSKYDNKFRITGGLNGLIILETVDGSSIPFNIIKAGVVNDPEDYSIYCLSNPDAGMFDMGQASFVSGYNNRATNGKATAFGYNNNAYGKFSFVEGRGNEAGYAAHAEGRQNIASGEYSHAEGLSTNSTNEATHAEGRSTVANAKFAHAEGYQNTASGEASHAEGGNGAAIGNSSHKEGNKCFAYSKNSHAEGEETIAGSVNSPNASGIGQAAHAEGYRTTATGNYSHAEGAITTASGNNSHSEGVRTTATGSGAHAEGTSTNVYTQGTNTDDNYSLASGQSSHVEGLNTKATATAAHAEGNLSVASGAQSHAEGEATKAKGRSSHTEGEQTVAKNRGEHACGRFNKSNSYAPNEGSNPKNTLHSVGIGTSDTNRKNAHEIMQDGKHYIYGIGGYDGTNAVTPNAQGIIAKSVQEVINELVNIINEITTSETN